MSNIKQIIIDIDSTDVIESAQIFHHDKETMVFIDCSKAHCRLNQIGEFVQKLVNEKLKQEYGNETENNKRLAKKKIGRKK